MSVMASSTDICTLRLQNALLEPLHIRCQEIGRITEEFSSKELHSIYPFLVGDIFGISNQIGWGLRRTFKSYQPLEYAQLLEFFQPEGKFFKLCYKLLANNFYLKYDFPLSYLPTSVRNMIEDGIVPSFYTDFLKIDPQTGTPAVLALNAFELFIFHFAYHLVRPVQGGSEMWADLWDTAYLQLAIDYSCYFLRCDNTSVPPVVGFFLTRNNITVLPAHRASPRMPTLFRQTVYNATTSPSTGTTTGSQGYAEVWRSELLAQVFLDYWLDARPSNSQVGPHSMQQYPQMTSLEHIRVVRNLLKHIHQLTNSCTGDGSTMDEFKRLLLPTNRAKIYSFLRRTIDQWPLDSSFRLILETWLSFIQPWRYTNNQYNLQRDERAVFVVDRRWMSFIVENLLAYTVIFQQMVNRLSRLDLASPKNASMLARLTKVFSQGDLCAMFLEIESQNHKYSPIIQQQCLELEAPGFIYEPMFSQPMLSKMSAFVRQVVDARQKSVLYVDKEKEKQEAQPSSIFGQVYRWFWSSTDVGDYSLEDRRKAVLHLDSAIDQLCTMFMIEKTDITSFGHLDCSLSSEDDTMTSDISFRPQELTPQAMQEKRRRIKYEGDPDLQPIRSWENTFLVRLLYHACTKLNEMYGDEMSALFHRRDLIGRMARQVLQPPQMIHSYKSRQSNTWLPPRLSLRVLASHRVLVYFVFGAFVFCYLMRWSPTFYVLILILLWAIYVLIKAILEPFLSNQ